MNSGRVKMLRRAGVRLALLGLVGAGLASAAPGIAQAADPVPFATLTATATLPTVAGAPVASTQPDVIAKVTTATADDSPVQLSVSGVALNVQIDSGDSVWLNLGALAAGGAPSVSLVDPNPGDEATVAFYAPPAVAADFSGTDSADDPSSQLAFVAPVAASYQATVMAYGVGASVAVDQGHTLFATKPTSVLQLGQLPAGIHELTVGEDPGLLLGGSSALPSWILTVEPVTIAVTKTSFAKPRTAPGVSDTLNYSVNGLTSITITVADSRGRVVATLASAAPTAAGKQRIAWNGQGAPGHDVPDGTYTATVASTDPFGAVTTAPAAITVQRPVAPLVRALYRSYLIDALAGSPKRACAELSHSAQVRLNRQHHAQSCRVAIRRLRAGVLHGRHRLRRRAAVVKAVRRIARRLRVRHQSIFAARVTFHNAEKFDAVERHDKWRISKLLTVAQLPSGIVLQIDGQRRSSQ